ncbi:hypothetical protein NECAME_13558 [Necator americanus]|uniref:Uncharacterized protein n=1 Tax=Necator americanus TaxID=51031 RepID=W2SXD5_NECAM|nr:hypothetical protein NECAME_13558 [Necator americanus]ETN73297.1 hypothetical protein NECAME_13558 [Necator americanus]
MAICTYNARMLALEAVVEDLMMQAKKIKSDVVGLTETSPSQRRACDSGGVGGVGVLVNRNMAKNIDSFEQLTPRIRRLRMRRCGPTSALTIFVAYAPTSSYEEEDVESFYMDSKNFYREDHAFYKIIIDPRRTPKELHTGPRLTI